MAAWQVLALHTRLHRLVAGQASNLRAFYISWSSAGPSYYRQINEFITSSGTPE